MKHVYLLFGLFILTNNIIAQKYLTKTGHIHFEASVPSFEEVDAENKTVTAILNTETGEIAALALVKGFRFKIALMEEHFNESYAESTEFPKATFSGKIDGFSIGEVDDEVKTYNITGNLTFHGKTKNITIEAQFSKRDNIIEISSKFTLTPEEFDIQLPKVVRYKVADTVTVSFNFVLTPKNQQ